MPQPSFWYDDGQTEEDSLPLFMRDKNDPEGAIKLMLVNDDSCCCGDCAHCTGILGGMTISGINGWSSNPSYCCYWNGLPCSDCSSGPSSIDADTDSDFYTGSGCCGSFTDLNGLAICKDCNGPFPYTIIFVKWELMHDGTNNHYYVLITINWGDESWNATYIDDLGTNPQTCTGLSGTATLVEDINPGGDCPPCVFDAPFTECFNCYTCGLDSLGPCAPPGSVGYNAY